MENETVEDTVTTTKVVETNDEDTKLSNDCDPKSTSQNSDVLDSNTKASNTDEKKDIETKEKEQETEKNDDIKSKEKEESKEKDKDNPDDGKSEEEKKKKQEEEEEEKKLAAQLEEERAKLKEKLEKHKQKCFWIVATCNAIDFVLASMLLLPVPQSSLGDENIDSGNDYTWKWLLFQFFFNPFYSLSRLTDTRGDTLDSAIVIILRVICLWKFIQLTIKWGHPNTHEKIQESPKTKKEFEESGMYKLGETIAWVIDIVVSNSVSKDTQNDHIKQMKEQRKEAGGDSGVVNNFMDAGEDDKIRAFSIAKVISSLSDYDAQDSADFWKSTLWVLLFTGVSVFQGYIGIKLVFFKNASSFYICIYLINILVSHFELYWTQKYLDDCTEPDNKFIAESLHTHPLFKRRVGGHWCDLCWKRISTHAYRCAKCDFDVCPACWKNKEKARLAAQNQIRNDSSKDNESLAEMDKPVTLREYFTRNLVLHLPHMYAFIIGLIVLFINSGISVSLHSSKGKLFDNIIEKNLTAFYIGIQWYVFLTVINGILNTIQSFILNRVKETIMNDVQKELFHRTMSQDMVFYDGSTPSALITRCTWGLGQMMEPFQKCIRTGIRSGTSIIGGVIMCWTISYRLTLLGLSTLGPIAYLGILFRKWYWDNLRQTWKMHHEVRRVTNESFQNIKTIRSFGKEPSIIEHYKDLRDELHHTNIRASAMNSLTQTMMSWFHLAGSTLITWAGGVIVFLSLMNNNNENDDGNLNSNNDSFWLNDTLTLGQLMAFELYWNRFKGDIENLRRLMGSFEEAKFKARQIFRTLDAKPTIEQVDSDDFNDKERKKCDDIKGDICFNNVHFTYQLEPNKEILKGINLKIPKGQTTAFVGKSGGGKTTIISMLLRFYDPTDGSITINDSKTGKIIDDIRNYNVYSWRNVVALVSQDTELFGSQTMAHNIGFGKDFYTKREMYYSSNLANAHEFIMTFDDKYDARIGDRGNKLSGGQKQRISIARMLMKKPKLMLLGMFFVCCIFKKFLFLVYSFLFFLFYFLILTTDEATSALDAESEAIVQAALEHAMQDTQCTVILVAHRLSTVINADQICVIHDGKVAESGTHDELLEKKGVYAKLVDRQVNLKKTMKEKVKGMVDGKDGKNKVNAKNIDSIDALMDEINKKSEESDKEKEDSQSKEQSKNNNERKTDKVEEDRKSTDVTA